MNLQETIAKAFYKTFYSADLEEASKYRREVSTEVADAILIALRDYPPSVNMCEVWSDLHPTKGLATEWYYMIQAAINEGKP